jgi:hypothetical protein
MSSYIVDAHVLLRSLQGLCIKAHVKPVDIACDGGLAKPKCPLKTPPSPSALESTKTSGRRPRCYVLLASSLPFPICTVRRPLFLACCILAKESNGMFSLSLVSLSASMQIPPACLALPFPVCRRFGYSSWLRHRPLVAHCIHTRTHSQLRRLADSADLEALRVLVEDLGAVVLPERLGGVAAGHALQDLGASGVLVDESWGERVSVSDGSIRWSYIAQRTHP